jgi:predicted alpha/beta hydrolase family esterase
MGVNLAFEVEDYIDTLKKKDSNFKLGKISFIGHSLGGLIIRAALKHLKFYKHKMHGLMTFATPHLGSIKHNNKLIHSAMWVMKKATGSLALH